MLSGQPPLLCPGLARVKKMPARPVQKLQAEVNPTVSEFPWAFLGSAFFH